MISNEILKSQLLKCKYIRVIGSEEEKQLVNTEFTNAPYMICFDPLDGSSNIGVNITTGTIFAVYKYNKNKFIEINYNQGISTFSMTPTVFSNAACVDDGRFDRGLTSFGNILEL